MPKASLMQAKSSRRLDFLIGRWCLPLCGTNIVGALVPTYLPTFEPATWRQKAADWVRKCSPDHSGRYVTSWSPLVLASYPSRCSCCLTTSTAIGGCCRRIQHVGKIIPHRKPCLGTCVSKYPTLARLPCGRDMTRYEINISTRYQHICHAATVSGPSLLLNSCFVKTLWFFFFWITSDIF
jgi:hypothetical protein